MGLIDQCHHHFPDPGGIPALHDDGIPIEDTGLDHGVEQAEDYARRKGWDLQTAEKWLAPNLGYEPED
jgi:hypothetical protein